MPSPPSPSVALDALCTFTSSLYCFFVVGVVAVVAVVVVVVVVVATVALPLLLLLVCGQAYQEAHFILLMVGNDPIAVIYY